MEKKAKKQFGFAADYISEKSGSDQDIYLLQSMLSRYGYLSRSFVPGKYDDPTRRAVNQFQMYYGIDPEVEGDCDHATVKLLTMPRCGVPDGPPVSRTSAGRLAPYVTVGAKWQTNRLSYKFLNATPDLPINRQQEIIREAFNRWGQVCALEFIEVTDDSPVDLPVSFHHGSHGDGYPFDDGGGSDGNTLAHAFFPPPAGGDWAGSLHFDEYEIWKDQPGGSGIRLFNVALHEIGHLLGLQHSQDNSAIMYAYYAEDRNDLQPDDIAGVQSLYGAAVEQPVAIEPGQTVSGYLPQKDAELNYQLTLQNKLLFKLDGPAGQDFDLFVRYGQPVERQAGKYDQVSWGLTADEVVTIDAPKAGTYYITVHSYRGLGNFNLEVDVT